MGYTFNSISTILDEKKIFSGKKVVTLGTLYPYVNKREADALNRRGLNLEVAKEQFSKHLFVERMGAKSCDSLDVSDYQSAEIICNLNHPLPQKLLGQYDVVYDAGTLEHLSNLPMALTNIFSLLREGGIYYFGVPCNNWVDHGFFQFSPTFFKDLCIDNSQLKLIALNINTSKRSYDYSKQNPAFMRSLLISRQQLNICGVIKKLGDGVSFDLTQTKYRQMHDYQRTSPNENCKPHIVSLIPSRARPFVIYSARRFIDSIWIPLLIKELILNCLYRYRNKLHSKVISD